MSELRKDPVTGRWVIIASERGNRPGALPGEFPEEFPTHGSRCPFCEGNEDMTPNEVLAFRDRNSQRNKPGWWVRVVPNKYPAMRIEGPTLRVGEGMYDMMSGIGAHEVVIEDPHHDVRMSDMPEKQIEEIFWAFRERMLDLHRDRRFRYVMIFKNHGAQAGATLEHAHSQIIALPIIPKRVLEELDGSQNYYQYKERCVFCDIIHQEERDNVRVVESNERFIAFHPYASRFPYETWILPRQHESFFSDIQIREVSDLARIFKNCVSRFKTVLNDPPYNFIIHTAPFTEDDCPHYHWHIELIPRLTRMAGFEWGTGFYINPISPEAATIRILNRDAENTETPTEKNTN
ncbi:TPA: galactose-1-phosphate uridylyltransferase [Candidatus Sumerlaeota bacterium]|jgi:UDPglucose--hexose-1-phosphate uridylyltransferase|nr:galactose-1-phosphate uridylyltransferase [Candidatus Sumerlaeota bacterium]